MGGRLSHLRPSPDFDEWTGARRGTTEPMNGSHATDRRSSSASSQGASASRTFGRDPAELRTVRRWVADLLHERGVTSSDVVERVVLMADELVANVIEHTGATPDVELSVQERTVELRVHDDDPAQPRLRAPGEAVIGGNGLRIVAGWSSDWGVDDSRPPGKAVWAQVPRW